MDLILELRKMGPASARSISRQELNEPPQRRPAQQVKHQPKRPQMASLEVSDFMRSQYEEELRQYELEMQAREQPQAAQPQAPAAAAAPALTLSAGNSELQQTSAAVVQHQREQELAYQQHLQQQAHTSQQAQQAEAANLEAQMQQQKRRHSLTPAAPAAMMMAQPQQPPSTAGSNQHVKDYMRSLLNAGTAAPWPYNQKDEQQPLRDRQTAAPAGGNSYGRVPHASRNRMFAMENEDGVAEPLSVVGGAMGEFDKDSIRKLPTRSQATVPMSRGGIPGEDESAFPAAGRALTRDGGRAAWQGRVVTGKQTTAEVWSLDQPDANYTSDRYFGRTGAHKAFLDTGRPQVVGGGWHGPPPTADARRMTTTPRDHTGANAPSPAVTPTDEADGSKHFGRCQTAWNDSNKHDDFKILGGSWVTQVDEQHKLPAKPTEFSPPATAYSDVDEDSSPLTARGGNHTSNARIPHSAAERNRLGSAMSDVLGMGGAFDLRSSMGAPSWSDLKKNQPSTLTLPYGMGEENLQPAKFSRRPSLAMEEKLLEDEASTSVLGGNSGWMGPSNLGSAALRDAERDSLVQQRTRVARPLSAKPNEMRLRQSGVVRQEEELVQRAAERSANTAKHRGACPWM